MRKVVAVGVLVMVGICGAVFGEEGGGKLPFAVSKETTGIVGPLRADGTVDYAQALNERYGKGVKAEENGYAGVMEILGTQIVAEKVRGRLVEMLGVKEGEGMKVKGYSEYLREKGGNMRREDYGQMAQAGRRIWTAEDFPQVAEYLTSQEKALERMKGACLRPKWWLPANTDDSGDLNSVQVAGVDEISGFLEPLGARAMMKLKGGDFDGFMSDVGALEQVAKGMQRGGRMVELDHGYSADTAAMLAVGGAAGSGKLTLDQCVKLWQWMDSLSGPTGPEDVFDLSQRWMMLERACLVATGKAASWSPELGKIEAKDVDWNAALKWMNASMDERIAQLKKATVREAMEIEQKRRGDSRGQGDLSRNAGETAEAYTQRVAMSLSGPTYSYPWGVLEARFRIAEMRRKMGRLMVGLAAYHAEKGAWPESLAQLKPAYVKEIPLDIYSEGGKEEVRYVHGSGGARVYSVGANGRDDGGIDRAAERMSRSDDIVVGVIDGTGGRKGEE